MAGALSGTQGPAVWKRGANVGEGSGAITRALKDHPAAEEPHGPMGDGVFGSLLSDVDVNRPDERVRAMYSNESALSHAVFHCAWCMDERAKRIAE